MNSITQKICAQGHEFYKSSDCPTCPICEEMRKPKSGFLSKLSAPARRALEHEGVETLSQLSKYTKSEILALHGIGPSSIPILTTELERKGLTFRK